jgi:2-phospho-L-lactate/phosphoenolpyruvate guanylyltransferase
LRLATVPPCLPTPRRDVPPAADPLRESCLFAVAGTRQGYRRGRWQDCGVANDWTAVIPVKRLGAAKSRLRGAVPDAWHEDLALAMVRDTVTAVLACVQVTELLVITDDPAVAAAVTALGAHAVPDDPGAGLNAAMRFGADVAAGPTRRRAVLAGDLPALRPEELSSALKAAGRTRGGRCFVPDAEGSGTVLLTASPGIALDPRFGVGSASAHAASGARRIVGAWPGLRQDVDTAADLTTVLALGPGEHTCALFRDLGRIATCGSSGLPAAPAR